MQNTTLAPHQRPLGVTIIAILAALQGIGLIYLFADRNVRAAFRT